jgi:hypothetical protein
VELCRRRALIPEDQAETLRRIGEGSGGLDAGTDTRSGLIPRNLFEYHGSGSLLVSSQRLSRWRQELACIRFCNFARPTSSSRGCP